MDWYWIVLICLSSVAVLLALVILLYKPIFKRVIDIVLSGLAIVVLIPLWIVFIIAIKIDSKGPVLFKQKRVGIHKKTFTIIKFRTMRIDAPHDMPTHMLENPKRL